MLDDVLDVLDDVSYDTVNFKVLVESYGCYHFLLKESNEFTEHDLMNFQQKIRNEEAKNYDISFSEFSLPLQILIIITFGLWCRIVLKTIWAHMLFVYFPVREKKLKIAMMELLEKLKILFESDGNLSSHDIETMIKAVDDLRCSPNHDDKVNDLLNDIKRLIETNADLSPDEYK